MQNVGFQFRFRRSIKILPGVRWNINKGGSSFSFGRRGFRHTVGPKGSRTTVGIPGTGVSYTKIHLTPKAVIPPVPGSSQQAPPQPNRSLSRTFYAIGIVLLVVWLLTRIPQQNQSTSSDHATAFQPSTTPTAVVTPLDNTGAAPIAAQRGLPPKPWASPNPIETPIGVRRAPGVAPTSPPLAAPLSSRFAASLSVTQNQPSSSPLMALPTPATHYLPKFRIVKVAPRDSLNVRAGPGATYPTVVRLKPGTRGIVLGSARAANGDTVWQQIVVGPYRGWVNESYLQPEALPP